MMKPHESITIANLPAPAQVRSTLGLYLFLLTLQTTGAVIILANGAPVYRQMVKDFANHKPQTGIIWWALVAVVLIQAAYWIRVRLQLEWPQAGHAVIGHLAGFIARLSFILGSSTFALIFLVRFDELSLPPHRLLMLLAILFSLFCWTLELERLAKALLGT